MPTLLHLISTDADSQSAPCTRCWWDGWGRGSCKWTAGSDRVGTAGTCRRRCRRRGRSNRTWYTPGNDGAAVGRRRRRPTNRLQPRPPAGSRPIAVGAIDRVGAERHGGLADPYPGPDCRRGGASSGPFVRGPARGRFQRNRGPRRDFAIAIRLDTRRFRAAGPGGIDPPGRSRDGRLDLRHPQRAEPEI